MSRGRCLLKEFFILVLSARQRLWAAIGLFSTWLIITSILLYRFGFAHYGTFDAEQQWHYGTPAITLPQLNIPVEQGWQVVHVLDKHCGCSRFARSHVELFADNYQVPSSRQHYLSAEIIAKAGLTIPAVPAVLLFDNGQLMYAGPYASGPLCSTNDSFLTSLLSRQVALNGLWLNGESKACRCLVSPGA